MCLFIETIKLRHGRLYNLAAHNVRANRTRREVLQLDTEIDLAAHIRIPPDIGRGLHRCRVVYGEQVIQVTIESYRRKPVRSLRLVDGGDIEYAYKYADRSAIDALMAQRAGCDEILIVKDGHLTDGSVANVALQDGAEWYTPSTPLLHGTQRQQLIRSGVLREAIIRVDDIPQYQRIVLFNALMDFDRSHAIPVSAIVI